MDKQKDIYIGNLKSRKAGDSEYLNGSICLSDIPKEWITESEKNGKKYLNITIRTNYKNEVDRFGNTHNIIINQYKPEPK